MLRHIMLASVIIAGGAAQAAFAENQPQTVPVSHVDVQGLTVGYRASKIIGADVVNGENQSVGKIDDLIITPSAKTPVAILSVGGVLGVGGKMVAVSTNDLTVNADKVTMEGATKDSLKDLPAFKYNK